MCQVWRHLISDILLGLHSSERREGEQQTSQVSVRERRPKVLPSFLPSHLLSATHHDSILHTLVHSILTTDPWGKPHFIKEGAKAGEVGWSSRQGYTDAKALALNHCDLVCVPSLSLFFPLVLSLSSSSLLFLFSFFLCSHWSSKYLEINYDVLGTMLDIENKTVNKDIVMFTFIWG